MQDYFIKHNHTSFKDALIKEADGLKALGIALKDNEFLFIPSIFHVDEAKLHIQKIYSKPATKENFTNLGYGLAQLHKKSYEYYGYDKDNYIGLNPQKNNLNNDWGEFFTEYRLQYQISLIKDSTVKNRFYEALEDNRAKLTSFLNETTKHPSLVHGDLWSGNVLFDEKGVWLIDPAVYYGDREVDIAMSEMFGGFEGAFYGAYEEKYPKSKEYDTKKVIYNLYHYLNHYNLFGSGYLSGCERAMAVIKKL